MDPLINPYYLSLTKPTVQKDKLTVYFSKSVSDRMEKFFIKQLNKLDEQIGLDFRIAPKNNSRVDVIVRFVDPDKLPLGSVGWARPTGNKWAIEIRGDGSLYSFWPGPASKKVFVHELGHVLGLDHNEERGLMYPNTVAASSWFNSREISALQSVWGSEI